MAAAFSLRSNTAPHARIRRTQSAVQPNGQVGSPKGNERTQSSPLLNNASDNSDGTFEKLYDRVEVLGEGAFGSVCSARSITDHRRYAIKRIPFFFQAHEAFGLAQLRSQVLREGKILAALDHPNVVRYYQCWVERIGIVRKHPDEVEVASTNTTLRETEKTEKAAHEEDVEEGEEDEEDEEERVDEKEEETEGMMTHWDDLDGHVNAREIDDASFLLSQSAQSWWEELDGEDATDKNAAAAESQQNKTILDDGKILLLQMDLFIVMKLYDRSLKHLIEYRRKLDISVKHNIRIMRELLEACRYIHEKGVVHRDISPCNVFFDGNSGTVLGDFGLASADSKHRLREISLRTVSTMSGTSPLRKTSAALPPRSLSRARPIERISTQAVLKKTLQSSDSGSTTDASDPIGKPLYAAPEQWENPGQPNSTTSKADMFSLGVLLIELFSHFTTGRERIETLSDVREGILTDEFVLQYPKVALLASKMLKKNPNERASAGELLKCILFQQEVVVVVEAGGCEKSAKEGFDVVNVGNNAQTLLLQERIKMLERFIVTNGLVVPL